MTQQTIIFSTPRFAGIRWSTARRLTRTVPSVQTLLSSVLLFRFLENLAGKMESAHYIGVFQRRRCRKFCTRLRIPAVSQGFHDSPCFHELHKIIIALRTAGQNTRDNPNNNSAMKIYKSNLQGFLEEAGEQIYATITTSRQSNKDGLMFVTYTTAVASFNAQGRVIELRIAQPATPYRFEEELQKHWSKARATLEELKGRLEELNRQVLDGTLSEVPVDGGLD